MRNISYNILGLIIIAIVTGYTYFRPMFKNRTNCYYKHILVFSLISTSLDIIFTILNSFPFQYPDALKYTVGTLFFMSYWPLAYVFFAYTLYAAKLVTQKNNKIFYTLNIAFMLEWIIILSTSFSHLIFYYDSQLGYMHGALYVPLALFNIILILSGGFVVLISKNKPTRDQEIAIYSYIFIFCLSNFIQTMIPHINITGFALACSTLIIYLSLQNPDRYLDNITGAYTRQAFREYLSGLISNKTKFQIIIVDIENMSLINSSIGDDMGTRIIQEVSRRVMTTSGRNYTFKIDGDSAIIVTKKIEERDRILEQLDREFPFEYKLALTSYTVKIHVHHTDTFEDFDSITEANDIITECALIAKKSADKITQNVISDIRRTQKIEKVLKASIENKTICIYLQPIYNTKTETFDRAEALIRLHDDELGLIMPNDFIPIAEENNTILDITPVIIEEVCKYVSTVTLPPTFKNISINLSSIDCQVDNFDRIILDTIERYNIDPSFLIFEITETIAFISPKIEKTMKNLKDHNILLALDDFGSGYANIDTLTKLPFDIVKIDRDMILLLNSVRYKTITLAIIRTIIDYGFDVIVEGVENKELAEVLKGNGAVHHQGFFYSEPIKISEFKEFLENNQ